MSEHGKHGNGHRGNGNHGHDSHGNPADVDRYIARMLDKDRAGWQRPDEVVAALGLRHGDTVGEVGAGPGYFTVRLARAVGPGGKVLAAEVSPEILAILRQRLAEAGVGNVVPMLARPEVPPFSPASCDRILLVNTFHHFADGPGYLRALGACLAPGGRIAAIDFHKHELAVGPPPELKVSREEVLAAAEAAGLAVAEEPTFLPHQFFLMLRAR